MASKSRNRIKDKSSNIDNATRFSFTSFFTKYYYYVPLFIILILGTISTIYYQNKLSNNIDVINAVITNKSHSYSKGTRWSNMSYDYIYLNKVYHKTETIPNKLYSKIRIGDTITIIISSNNPKISQWKGIILK